MRRIILSECPISQVRGNGAERGLMRGGSHPVAVGLYYEDQKTEAKRYAGQFRKERMPKFLGYFERVLGEKDWLVGDAMSYADLTLWQCVDGLKFA
jgi:glutathione S-transferase